MCKKRASFDALFVRFRTRTWLISDFLSIIIAETGSEDGVYAGLRLKRAIRFGLPRLRGAKMFV
ncbi:hypothetical protein HMPREF0201_00011 [Cedecea davisae DSM 4568]|uniref:Uncharacterized protein n=1 Tax=Cedecea davisae DSM 4568 TaxID=566551 RepID=S3J6T7_9ENTR|nr:hypothetical protein HMPREF0201_00011 [Cedecea davisae DSM 4568]